VRRVLVTGMAALFLLVGANVARADHTHVLILPNGNCAILAADGNEKYLILPAVLFNNNPNVDADDAAGGLENLPLNRRHPLHVLVHLGVPGADGDIAVIGSAQDPCAATGNYVNGQLGTAAPQLAVVVVVIPVRRAQGPRQTSRSASNARTCLSAEPGSRLGPTPSHSTELLPALSDKWAESRLCRGPGGGAEGI
jgi:hypothetical protein